MKRIYLDNNASTPLDARVLKVMVQELEATDGNPSSVHAFGQDVRCRMSRARRQIAEVLEVQPKEIIFTSGGTESINMVLKGALLKNQGHIITSNLEHPSVYYTLKYLEAQGSRVSYLQAGISGRVEPEQVIQAIESDTRLVTLLSVNNETGVKTDIETIAAYLYERKIPFVVDAVSHFGKELFTIPKGVSAICFSGHKFHAPKGVGMAFVRQGFKLDPLIIGGPQEGSKRGGTENVLGIVALSEAVRCVHSALPTSERRMQMLRDKLEGEILKNIPDVSVNGDPSFRICNTSNLCFRGVDGESLMMNLDLRGVATSHGSACASGSLEPSRILLNMGLSRQDASSSLRFSLSRMTEEEEIDQAVKIIVEEVTKLRSLY